VVRVWVAQQLALLAVVLLASLAALVGCTHVAPYEREAMTRPDMTTAEMAGPAQKHAAAVHEGATQSGAVAESGCGCN
jgi:hypothetical protein